MAPGPLERQRERARQVVADRLEPGEAVEFLLYAQQGQRSFLVSVLVPSKRWRGCWVEVTDRRVFLVSTNPMTGRPANIEWEAPRAGVRADNYERGGYLGRLRLRRVADNSVMLLHFAFNGRRDAIAVKDALGA
jgi:hypothetical protein